MCKKFFAFSFGGNDDFGKVADEMNYWDINFPKTGATGYGFAVRNGIDTQIPNKGIYEFSMVFNCKTPINLTVEIKTERSGGAPETSKNFYIEDGYNTIKGKIPENLSSKVKEIVLFISKHDNPEIRCSLCNLKYNFE